MTVEVLSDQQKENQKKVSKAQSDRTTKQRAETRNTVVALVVALLLLQCVDLFFATETAQHWIAEGSKKAMIVIDDFFVYLASLGAQCEARGESSALCQLLIQVHILSEQENSKEALTTEKSEEEMASPSEIFHVLQVHNTSTIYDETWDSIGEDAENMATLVKTVDTTENGALIANHPLIRLILHNPFFLQIILPFAITILALVTQKYIPGRGNATAGMAYFMLIFFFFARLFLQLY